MEEQLAELRNKLAEAKAQAGNEQRRHGKEQNRSRQAEARAAEAEAEAEQTRAKPLFECLEASHNFSLTREPLQFQRTMIFKSHANLPQLSETLIKKKMGHKPIAELSTSHAAGNGTKGEGMSMLEKPLAITLLSPWTST
jgi:hypothetical protein